MDTRTSPGSETGTVSPRDVRSFLLFETLLGDSEREIQGTPLSGQESSTSLVYTRTVEEGYPVHALICGASTPEKHHEC